MDATAPSEDRNRRGPYAKTAERRRDIVVAAIEVFSESGFREGTMRDVASRAGITPAGIRHHFPTKAHVLQALLRWRERVSLDKGDRTRVDGLDAMHAWIDAVAENVEQPILVELEFVLAGEAVSPQHPAHPHFARAYEKSERILRRAFALMEERGQLREDIDPDVAARAVLGVTLGIQSLWLRDRSIDIAAALRTQLDAMLTEPS